MDNPGIHNSIAPAYSGVDAALLERSSFLFLGLQQVQ